MNCAAEEPELGLLLDLALRTAREAGNLLREYFRHELDIREKESVRDLVSAADLDAERLIVERIRAERPDDSIVGEEFGASLGTSGLCWGIDPLDGTSNFLAGIPHWATVIGCEDARGSALGVIYDPNRDEVFAATRGAGATLNGVSIQASTCDKLSSSIAGFGPAWGARWHDHRIALSDRLLDAIAHGRQMGSLAVDLAWTAAGRFDFFYYDSDLNPWDVSMRVIAEEVGLVIDMLRGDDNVPGALVATPPVLRDSVLRLLNRPE